MTYEIKSSKSSLRNNILLSFFLVLAVSGITINLIFLKVIQSTLANEGLDSAVIENITRHFTLTGTSVTIGGILIVLFIAMFLAENFTRPIKKLTSGMIDIAQGKLDTRIEISSHDELGQLADGFNFMSEQIAEVLQKLRTAKEYTDNILISVPSILIVLNNNMDVLSTNKAFEKLQEQFPSLMPEQFVSQMKDEIRLKLTTGETVKKEIVIVPDGQRVSLIFSAIVSLIVDYRDDPAKSNADILMTITDITERKKMKELVLQSKQDWEDTFNTIPDMITIHDNDYNIIHANKAAMDYLALPDLDTNIISKCYKYYHGTDSAPEGCPSCECYKTELPATFELFEPHLNRYIEIRSIPRINNNNKLVGLIHIVRDISVRKEIEEEHTRLLTAITKAKIEWEMTFDSVMEFIVLIDEELKIMRCNRSFAEFVGEPASRITGKKCHDFFPCPYEQIEDCKEHMCTSRELLSKNELKTESGRWLYVSHRPIKDENTNTHHTVIIATEVTDIKNAQQKLSESREELKDKVLDLEKFYDMAVGRELKMKELKKEIHRLNNELIKHKEYDTSAK